MVVQFKCLLTTIIKRLQHSAVLSTISVVMLALVIAFIASFRRAPVGKGKHARSTHQLSVGQRGKYAIHVSESGKPLDVSDFRTCSAGINGR